MTAAEIAMALGGAHRSGAWWRARCPAHDSRGPTLALRDGDRTLLIKCFAGCDPRDVLAELGRRRLLGDAPHDRRYRPAAIARVDDRDSAAGRIAIARRIWDAARDACGSPVARYLDGRSITIAPPPSLRWAPSLRRPDGSREPAMVARIDDISGELVGISRTWLDRDAPGIWRRRDRAMLGRTGGGAVRLAPAAELLMVSEGVETGLSAQQACGLPCWAALSTSGLVALVLPAIVQSVIILADHDLSGAGERAARAAAARWLAEGRRVRVVMPPEPGDMADVLAGRAHARIAETCDAAA